VFFLELRFDCTVVVFEFSSRFITQYHISKNNGLKLFRLGSIFSFSSFFPAINKTFLCCVLKLLFTSVLQILVPILLVPRLVFYFNSSSILFQPLFYPLKFLFLLTCIIMSWVGAWNCSCPT